MTPTWRKGAATIGVLLLSACGTATDHAKVTAPPVSEPTTSVASQSSSTSSPTTTSTITTTSTPSTTSSTRPSGRTPTVVSRLPTTARVVALTFDAGSDEGFTSAILDRLAANGVKASFGITGRWAEAHPELVQRIVGEGHQVVNHTYDHASFTGRSTGTAPLTNEQRVRELDRAADAIRAAAGVTGAPWFRPPYGDRDASVDDDAAAAGYPMIAMWTVDSLGWNGLSAPAIVTRCLDAAAAGTIYLFHVGSQSADAQALQAIIDGLRSDGYGFTTLAAAVSG